MPPKITFRDRIFNTFFRQGRGARGGPVRGGRGGRGRGWSPVIHSTLFTIVVTCLYCTPLVLRGWAVAFRNTNIHTQYGSSHACFLCLSASVNMFYVIGLGLCDEKDITIKGLEVNKWRVFTFRVVNWYVASRPYGNRHGFTSSLTLVSWWYKRND